MKKLLSILFIMLSLSAFSQKVVFFEDIESNISDDAYFFEGFYGISNQDYVYLGSIYAMTIFDKAKHTLSLCVLTNSEIPQYVIYEYKVKDKNITEKDNGVILRLKDCFYSVTEEDGYFYVTFDMYTDHDVITYEGSFEPLDDPD